MIKYLEEGERLKDKSKCAHLRASLKMCMLETDCCKIERRTPRDCLLNKDPSVPDQCYALRQSFFECKHSIVNTTKYKLMEDEDSEDPGVTNDILSTL